MSGEQTKDEERAERRVEVNAPASAAVVTRAPESVRRFPRRVLAVSGVVASASVAFVLAYSVNLFGGGSLGAIADPSGRVVARIHAEGAGRGLAYELSSRSGQVKVAPPALPREGVQYVIQSGGTLQDIARIFAMPLEDLKALNPEVREDQFLESGAQVCVFKAGVGLASVQPGEPDKLYAGVPLMEGPGRRVRRRSRSWGTAWLVGHLDRALSAYGAAYPEGPVVIVSDISTREGGRLPPHHTHRSGRDVDLSYVPIPEKDNGGFLLMDKYTFDVKRNWSFLRALLETGAVELILMDTSLQKLLYDHLVSEGVSKEELGRIFQYPRDPRSEQGIVRHWDDHRDHMHVRFSCAPGDPCP